ncbi:MAG TPA: hypothetical protein PLD18_00310 [Flavobacterium sp.]|nr:hypothetical protein [Flavobacterium sp.]HRA71385.1 hypothetical protein [Flavobacterium sp.]
MITIRKNNFSALIYLIFFPFVWSCSINKNTPQIKSYCSLQELNFELSFSDSASDERNVELNNFFKSSNEIEIIIYSVLEGSNDFDFKRINKDNMNNLWTCTHIKNGVKEIKKEVIPDEDTKHLFADFKEKSYFQKCNNCFDCVYYNILIKKGNNIFMYDANSTPFQNLSPNDKEKIIIYEEIFKYFNKQR